DILVVALQSDASVRASGPSEPNRGEALEASGAGRAVARPVTPAAERAEILAALAAVDYVVEFDEPTPRELFARLAPEIVVKGGEAGSQESAFRDDEAVTAAGAQVVRLPLEPGHSTSLLITRITQLHA
ncbi:MAG: hypothetical protein WBY24_17390, partial [Candidatus Acidiferrales bacterium]